jgi:colicin import membrane protein
VARLNRLWNKRCDVEGFRNLDDIMVQFHLTSDGALEGLPQVISPHRADPVWQAAADAAVRAVYQAQPFAGLPKQTFSDWHTFNANYQAKEACK